MLLNMITEEQIKENLDRGWAPIEGFPFHRVTVDGRVQTRLRPGINKPQDEWVDRAIDNQTGRYKRLLLRHKGNSKSFNVHRLVALHFIWNPHTKPCVNHKDGNRFNNHFTNLEWVTVSENTQHAYDTGLAVASKGENHGLSKFKEEDIRDIRFRASRGETHTEIGKFYGVRQGCISRIVSRERWAHVA